MSHDQFAESKHSLSFDILISLTGHIKAEGRSSASVLIALAWSEKSGLGRGGEGKLNFLLSCPQTSPEFLLQSRVSSVDQLEILLYLYLL